MKEIFIEGAFGNERRNVKLLQITGVANCFQIYINDYYCGQLLRKNGDWIADLNAKGLLEFTSTDIAILGQIVES